MILASADSSAGLLRTLKARIDRIVHYSSVYDAVMRRHRKEVRARRKSTYTKVMAAVKLRATGGTIRGFAAFRRPERKSSGNISGVANVGEVREGSEIVWEQVEGDLDIYITQDGHEGAGGGDPLRWPGSATGPPPVRRGAACPPARCRRGSCPPAGPPLAYRT